MHSTSSSKRSGEHRKYLDGDNLLTNNELVATCDGHLIFLANTTEANAKMTSVNLSTKDKGDCIFKFVKKIFKLFKNNLWQCTLH